MNNPTNIYDPNNKFSEYFWEMRSEIPLEKLREFDEYIDKNNLVWVIFLDGAENGYIVIADIMEEIFTTGQIMTEDDFIALIDAYLNDEWE